MKLFTKFRHMEIKIAGHRFIWPESLGILKMMFMKYTLIFFKFASILLR